MNSAMFLIATYIYVLGGGMFSPVSRSTGRINECYLSVACTGSMGCT